MKELINIPEWLREKPYSRIKPPIETRINFLPLPELSWENFERLIYRLIWKDPEVHECRFYGVKGQNQKGIDIIAYLKDFHKKKTIVYQSKRIKTITASDIEKFVSRFLKEDWNPLPSEFVLCFSMSIKKTQLVDQIGKEIERLVNENIIFSVWDQEKIDLKLKEYPDIVEDFFGKNWVKAFISEEFFTSRIPLDNFCINDEEAIDLYSYHRWVYNRNQWLKLHTIPHRLSKIDKNEIKLSDVYINLETLERVATCEDVDGNVYRILQKDIEDVSDKIQYIDKWNLVRMTVIEAFKFYNKVVLLGEKGSGKSTAIQHLALCLAGDYMDDKTYWSERLNNMGWTHGLFIPIFISLSNFSKSPVIAPNASAIWDFIMSEYRAVNKSFGPMKKILDKGKAIILLDDLHRVSKENLTMVMKAILDFSILYPLCRYIITCRERNYDAINSNMLPGFRAVSLAPLMPKQIDMFIENLYEELRNLGYQIYDDTENDLQNAIHNSDLAQLGEIPRLLTQMAFLHISQGKLPDNRVDFYSEVLKLFLNSRDKGNEDSSLSSEDPILNNIDFNILEKGLCEMAYFAFIEKEISHIEKTNAINIICDYLDGDTEKAIKYCDFSESTLELIRSTDNNTLIFPNRPLQEFMVAQYMQRQHDFISKGIDNAREDFSKWHNVIAMAIRLAGPDIGVSAVRSLCPFEPPSKINKINETEVDWYSIWMGAEALSELGLEKVNERLERKEVLERIRKWLILLIESETLSIREKNEIGKLLSKLGDTRDGILTIKPYLIKIPKGCVMLGNDRITKGHAYRFEINYDYYVSKYLVTNAQYEMFLSDNPTHLLPYDEGNVWKAASRKPNSHFLNHPVVGVSWDDANAYCRWLTKKLKTSSILPENYIVRLPTDAEWMKMYRGGEQLLNSTPNLYPTRLYPWGNEWIDGYANEPDKKTSLYQTTTVGIYPKGTTPYGILDACGNVLEWTSTSWGSDDIEEPGFPPIYNPLDGRESPNAKGLRIVRGGSWLFSEGTAQCACRLDPSNKFPDTGFRVFVGPKDINFTLNTVRHSLKS